MLLTGTTHVSSPSSLLNSILIDKGPLGGDVAAHTAPYVRSNSLHSKFCVCRKKKFQYLTAFITKETFGVIENIGCLYLTQLHGDDVTLPLLMPYNKTQIMRVVAAISDLESNIFVGVAAGYPD